MRIKGEICVWVKGSKRGCYSQKHTGDMYGAIQNDGGSSRHLDNCYYKPIGEQVKKGNYPFATVSARNADKSPITSYTVVKGALPPGLSLQKSTGMIYGDPTKVEKATGW